MKRGALKGLGNSMGVSHVRSYRKEEEEDPRAVKTLRAAPGWEDFTEGRKLRRQLLPEYDDDTDDDEET